MSAGGVKYRVRCIGSRLGSRPGCGFRGVRTSRQCECYDEFAYYCRPTAPGPGCPAGVNWPCPRCKGSVTGKEINRG